MSQQSIDFSVIIVNYCADKQLRQAVTSFQKIHRATSWRYEIITIDNSQQTKRGFGGANNLAARQARGRYLLFLNPDTITTNDILTPLAHLLAKPTTGLVAPQLVTDQHHTPQAFACGHYPTLWRTLSRRAINNEQLIIDRRQLSIPVDWLSGACLAITRQKFFDLGGFDERFQLYFEDVDLCQRAHEQHWVNYLLPHTTIIHLGGARPTMTRQRRAHYFRAQTRYFAKWLPIELPLLLLLRLPYQLYCYLSDDKN